MWYWFSCFVCLSSKAHLLSVLLVKHPPMKCWTLWMKMLTVDLDVMHQSLVAPAPAPPGAGE